MSFLAYNGENRWDDLRAVCQQHESRIESLRIDYAETTIVLHVDGVSRRIGRCCRRSDDSRIDVEWSDGIDTEWEMLLKPLADDIVHALSPVEFV